MTERDLTKSNGVQGKAASRRWVRWLRLPVALILVMCIFWISGCMERLFYYPTIEPTPAPSQFRGAEKVQFVSQDGTHLTGWFIPAQGKRAATEHTATILHVHGNAGSMNSHLDFVDFLPYAGFNLFMFDYRGYGESQGRARSRVKLIADTHAALDYVLGREDVDASRVVMLAQSLGGSIGLNVMAERGEIKAAVVESAFASWREMAACALGGGTSNFLCNAAAAVIINDSHRPDRAIAEIDRPILLIAGVNDSIVPAWHSRKLQQAAHSQVRLIELQDGDHNSLRDHNPLYTREITEFFRTALSPAARDSDTAPTNSQE